MRRRWVIGLTLASLLMTASAASAHTALRDSIMDKLTGDWIARGPLLGRVVCDTVHVQWVLGDQFLQFHMKSRTAGQPYEAMIFLGLDGTALSAHWLDTAGPAYATILGTGRLEPDGASLTFAYPDGAYHNRLSFDGGTKQWRWLIQRGMRDTTTIFSDWRLSRPGRQGCAGG